MRGFLSRWGRERRDGAFQKRLTSATVAGPNYLIAFLLLHGGLYRPAEWRQSALTWPDPEQAACALYRTVTESAQRPAEWGETKNSNRSESFVQDRNYKHLNKLKQLNKRKGEKMCTNGREFKMESDTSLTCLVACCWAEMQPWSSLLWFCCRMLMTWSCSDLTDRWYKHTISLWPVQNTFSAIFIKFLFSVWNIVLIRCLLLPVISVCPQRTRRILQVSGSHFKVGVKGQSQLCSWLNSALHHTRWTIIRSRWFDLESASTFSAGGGEAAAVSEFSADTWSGR